MKSKLAYKLLIVLLLITVIPLLAIFSFSIRNISSVSNLYIESNKKFNKDIISNLENKLVNIAETNLKQIIYEKKKFIEDKFVKMEKILDLNSKIFDFPTDKKDVQIFFNDDFNKKDKRLNLLYDKTYTLDITLDNYVVKLAPGTKIEDVEKPIKDYLPKIDLIKNIYENNKLIFWIYTGFEAGYHISYPGHGGYSKGYDPRKRNWYKKTKEKMDLYWEEPYVDATTSNVLIACCKPLYSGEKFVGVTSLDMNISILKDRLFKIDTFNSEKFIIVNSDGKILISENNVDSGKFIKSSEKEKLKEIISDLKNRNDGFRALKYNNEDAYWAYSEINSTKWYAFVIVPKKEVLGFVDKLKTDINEKYEDAKKTRNNSVKNVRKGYLYFSLITLIIIIFVSIIMSNFILKPIREMTTAADRIANGDFDFQLKDYSKDEIGYLMKSFNKMIKGLKERDKFKKANIAFEQELLIGREMQQSLLPTIYPEFKTIQMAAKLIPAKEIGGDLYNFINLPNDKHGIVIGDVAGKGIHAGLFMAMSSAILKSINTIDEPGKITAITNNAIIDYFEDDAPSHVTVGYVVVDEVKKQFIFANCGHEYPVLYKKKNNKFEYVKIGGMPVGMFYNDDNDNTERVINYEEGDVLILYTDGFTECTNDLGEEYGRNEFINFIETVIQYSPDKIIDELFKEMERFENGAEPSDDKALIVLKGI